MISLNKHSIDVTIHDRYATIDYLFQFKNNSTQQGSNELQFEITIDPKSFISQFKTNIDGQIFIGKTKEKQTASHEYTKAKANNQNTILIKQTNSEIPNLFTISTNINNGSEITLTITIEQYLTKTFNFNALDIQILRNFDKYSIAQNYDFIAIIFNINDHSGIYDIMINNIPIKSKHSSEFIIYNQNIDKTTQKCLINGKLLLKTTLNEIKLQYKIKGEQNESMILYDNKSNTFCHIISDISFTKNNNTFYIPRRVVFIIDKSGSMQGDKWTKTINATITALKQLRHSYDKYCIVLFDDIINVLPCDKLMLCDEININNTISLLQKCIPNNGTNINDALIKGVNMIKKDILIGKDNGYIYINQIFFITDGQVTQDTKMIVNNIKNMNYSEKISIFTFGVGCDNNTSEWINKVNHSFLKLLAVNNNGFYKRIKESYTNDVLNNYFKMLSKPILCDINIKYNNKNIYDLTNNKFNSLYYGNDLIICGKMNITNEQKECQLNVIINAISTQNGKPINISKQISTNVVVSNGYDNIEKIWAYQTLQQLAIKKLIYNDMIEIEENEKKDQNIALTLAMKYQFITPWTSMIIVDKNNKNIQETQSNINKGLSFHPSHSNDIFSAKTKEIERRIIKHLHQRGYTESHPDYDRYMAKAKELAIQKCFQNNNIRNNNNNMKQKPTLKTINTKNKYLIILRGLPGSGKTTLANKISSRNKNSIICSEDKYHWSGHIEGIGTYKFDPSLVFSAREWCNKEIIQSIINGIELVIIDNHNSKLKMYEKHIEFAIKNGYIIKIMEFICNESLIDKYKLRSYKPFPRNIYIKLLQLWEKDPRAQLINPIFNERIKVKPVIKTVLNTFPMRYEIRIQAVVRAEIDLNSSHVTDLPEGTIINVKQIIGNRGRISYPVYGWLSIKSKFNEFIIVPTHIDYEKIGGKVLFKNKILINGKYVKQGTIIDYNEIKKLYKIKCIGIGIGWISLKDKNIIFIKEKHDTKLMLSGTTQPFSLQKTEIFFNEFFCRDYPQYHALSSSTKEKMEIGTNNIKTISNYSRIW